MQASLLVLAVSGRSFWTHPWPQGGTPRAHGDAGATEKRANELKLTQNGLTLPTPRSKSQPAIRKNDENEAKDTQTARYSSIRQIEQFVIEPPVNLLRRSRAIWIRARTNRLRWTVHKGADVSIQSCRESGEESGRVKLESVPDTGVRRGHSRPGGPYGRSGRSVGSDVTQRTPMNARTQPD